MAVIIEQKIKIPDVDLIGMDCILVVKVGNEERPALNDDIIKIRDALEKAQKDKDFTLITHHAIDFMVIPKDLLKNVLVVGNLDYLIKNVTELKVDGEGFTIIA